MIIQDRVGKYKQANRNWFTRAVSGIKVFSVHHDAIPHDNRTADQIMQQIMNGHVAQGWPGMSYHYFIHRDGSVYNVNKHEWVTWIDGVNWDAIGIVLTGYFHPTFNNSPTPEQLKSLKELLDELSTKHPEFPADQDDVYGHRERAQTSCLPLDITEILTDKGFVKLENITMNDTVAQFDEKSKEITFGKITRMVDPFFSEVLVNKYIEQTENHQSLRYTSRENLIKEEWGSMQKVRDVIIPVAGKYVSEGLDLINDELKYLVAVQADGHYARDNRIERVKNGKRYNTTPYEIGVEFHFKKERKIERCKKMLESLHIQYKTRTKGDGRTILTIPNSERYNREWCEKYLNNKRFTNVFLSMNKEQADIFLEELRYWDGRSTVDHILYSSAIKINADIVQAIATLHGYRGKLSKAYEVSITYKDKQTIPNSYSKRNTLVGCIEVEKGNIVVRQKGFVFITGNCPGDKLFPYAKEYREKKGQVLWGGTDFEKLYYEAKNRIEQLNRDVENERNRAGRFEEKINKAKAILL